METPASEVPPAVPSAPKLTSEQQAMATLDRLEKEAEAKAKESTPIAPAAPAAPVGGEKKEEPPAETDAAKRFAMLAKKEAGLLSRQQKLKAESDAFEAKQKEFSGREAESKKLADVMRGAKTNIDAYLAAGGLTLEDVIAAKANGATTTPDLAARAVKEQLDAFRAEQANAAATARKAQENNAKAQADAAMVAFRDGTKAIFASQPKEYLHCMKHGDEAVEVVTALTEELYNRSATPITTREGMDKLQKEARDLTEAHYREIHTAIAKELASAPASAPETKSPPPAALATPKPPALSNSVARTTPPVAERNLKNGSRAKERAILEVLNKALVKA